MVSRILYHGGVVQDAHRAPHIGDGILVFRVEIQIQEPLVDILEVGDVVLIQLMEQVFLDQPLDDIVGGETNVVDAIRLLQLHHHLLVGGHGGIVYLYAGLLFKLGQQGFVDIIPPIQHIQGVTILFGGAAEQGAYQQDGQDQGDLLHFFLFPP